MPYRTSSPESRGDAELVVTELGCASELIDITPIVDGYFNASPDGQAPSNGRRGNFAARARMAVIHDRSVTWGGLVCGTSNKTEALLGYTTIFGDNAAAIDAHRRPVQDPGSTAVLGYGSSARHLGQAADSGSVARPDGRRGAGITYAAVDRLLYWMIDRRRTFSELVAMGFDETVIETMARRTAAAEFKRQTPVVAKLTTRTPGVDYLYPRRRPEASPARGRPHLSRPNYLLLVASQPTCQVT